MDKENRMSNVDLFEIPWELDVKNPVNIGRRRQLREQLENERRQIEAKLSTRKPLIMRKPAKSVRTQPNAETAPSKPKVKAVSKPVAPKGPRASKYDDTAIIRVLVTDFGHKPGSQAVAKSAALVDGMTVAEYKSDGLGFNGKWHTSHISHCLGKGFIRLESK